MSDEPPGVGGADSPLTGLRLRAKAPSPLTLPDPQAD